MIYKGGVIHDTSCGTSLNHGVLTIGYGSDTDSDYYIVKNSCGASWGEEGYIRLSFDDESHGEICGILLDET